MISILREPHAFGVREPDTVDESELVKLEGIVDNDDERTTWVEYRFPGSDVIVHRSAHVTLKKVTQFGVAIAQPLSLDGWAQDLIAGLVRKRQETGAPVELTQRLTPEELAAVRRALAQTQNVATLTVGE